MIDCPEIARDIAYLSTCLVLPGGCLCMGRALFFSPSCLTCISIYPKPASIFYPFH